ncbi:MAG: hypothetical protein LV481_13380 [Methylacidiphilales bacterium]|nr:hypothetical protein [Candidatus Methylacidiphilales bacterium]
MLTSRQLVCGFLLGLCLAGPVLLPAAAEEKEGMPDLGQQDQTCLPTSTANLLVWFGTHGYPRLIVDGDSKDNDYIHTVHAIIGATDARYDLGTRTDAISYGIQKYIHDAGYDCDVEYRGLDWNQVKFPDVVKDDDGEKYKPYQKTPGVFTQDWLQENNAPNKGFILLLAYCNFDRASNTFQDAIPAGHAVTLVNAEPDMILVHDPAHENDEPGRKILTPEALTGGTFQLPGYSAPVSGLLLLSGSLLESPFNSQVMLTGAICVTMHPGNGGASGYVGASGATVGAGETTNATPSSAPAAPASSPNRSWVMWLFDLILKK